MNPTHSNSRGLKRLVLALAAGAGILAGTVHAATLTWAVTGGTWDTTSANWTGDATIFTSDGTEHVIFTGSTGGTVTVWSDMSPASTTVSGGDYLFSGGPLAGSGTLTKSGSGTLRIDDLVPGTGDVVENTYTGGTIMNGGTLHLGAMFAGISPGCRGALGTGPVTLNGGTIEFDNYTATNDLIANGGTLYSTNGWGATWSGPITLNATLTCTAGYGLTCSGTISGTGGLDKTGGDVLILSGTNSYTGQTVVNSGRLQYNVPLSNVGTDGPLGAPAAGPNSVIDLYPGTTFLYGGPQGPTNSGSQHPEVTPYSITDRTINLAGTGSGKVTLNGNNCNDTGFRFDGPFTATGTGPRTLEIRSNGDRPLYIYNGAIPDTSDNQVTVSLVWSSGSSSSDGRIELNGANTFTGPLNLNGGNNGGPGTVRIGGTGVLGNGNYAGAITFTANPASAILDYASSANQTLAGVISGPGAVTVSGSGILTLSGANDYGGNTTVNSGCSLVLDTAGELAFKPTTSTTSNKLTGPGTAHLNGHFAVDSSALDPGTATGSWTVVDVTNPVYGGTFGVTGFTGPGPVWTKVAGAQTWTFNQTTGVLSLSAPALISSFSYLTYNGIINQSALTISMTVPIGTDVANLAPTYTVSSGTGSPVSGTTRNFTSPQTYTVTDGLVHNTYTVTVSFFAGLNEHTYLGRNSQSDLDPISNLMAITPNATGHQVDNIDYHGDGFATLPGSPGPDNFSILWEGWFDVLAAGGHGTYTFGTSSDDGSVIYMDLNGNGSFADAGEYIVNNNYYQGDTARTGEVTLNTDSVHMVIGYYEGGGGYDMRAAWKKGTGYGFDALTLINGTSGVFFPTDPHPPVAQILSFGISGHAGVINQATKTISLFLPHGTPVTNLAPTYTVSTGTCLPASGSAHNFTGPVTYTVTDGSTVNDYVVTVTVLPPGPPVTDYARWFDASTLGLADNAPVTQWNDGSGNAANATVPDGNATPVYVANAGTESGLGAIYFARNDGPGNSGALEFTRDSEIRTVFSVFKGASFLLTDHEAYDFHRADRGDTDPADPLWESWTSGNIMSGQTYVNGTLWPNGASDAMPTDLHKGFNLVEVLTNGDPVQADSFNKDRDSHAGNQYQAEVIIYDRVLSEPERLQVESYLTSKWFASAPPVTDYSTWANGYLPADVSNPAADYDGDGLTNFQEYAFGLDPTSGKSCSPVTVPRDKSAGTFEDTRRAPPATTGLTYTVWTSTDLVNWTKDAGAVEGTVTTAGEVQTVPVTISSGLLSASKLFVRVLATDVPAPPGGM